MYLSWPWEGISVMIASDFHAHAEKMNQDL